jgi:60 kDa SS-A/Ro ribonucleoprotein
LRFCSGETAERANVYAFNEKAYEVPPRRGFALRDALAATKNNWSRGGLAVAAANCDGYDWIIVITDGQWHFSDTTTVRGYGEGDPQTVAPAPLTKQAYMVNVASYKNGVGYGKWMNIDGWSDSVIEYIRALEQTKWENWTHRPGMPPGRWSFLRTNISINSRSQIF